MTSKHWKSILVVVTNPFAREQLAATKAAAIARRCGARITLFNAFMIPQPVCDVPMDSQQQIIASAIRQRRERLHKLASTLRLSAPVQCIVHWDYPAHEAIVRQVVEQEPDVLVTESHRHGRFARLVLANTDWELIRSCPCPVWFVRSPQLPRSPRLLVAVDPRHAHAKPARLDDRLLRAARSVTDQLDGRIDVVHAYETPVSGMPGILMEPVRLPIAPQRTREFVDKTRQSVQLLAQKYGITAEECFIDEGRRSAHQRDSCQSAPSEDGHTGHGCRFTQQAASARDRKYGGACHRPSGLRCFRGEARRIQDAGAARTAVSDALQIAARAIGRRLRCSIELS
jgi:universal stress protein E